MEKDLELEEVKKIELELLKYFLEICNRHNLKYYLVAGTCLGAVRHQGFIPWDDDIDVGMPRKDYEKFLEIAQAELPEHIFLQTGKTDPDYPLNYAKLRNSNTTFWETSYKYMKVNEGIFLDIFPYDGTSNAKIFKLKKSFYEKNILLAFHMPSCDGSFKRRFIKRFARIFFGKYQKFRDKRDKLLKKNEYEKCDIVADYAGTWGDDEICPKVYFGNGTMAKFEGLDVVIPENYDAYLKSLYGDYMQLPPEEARHPHHYCEVIDTQRPYTDYELINDKIQIKEK